MPYNDNKIATKYFYLGVNVMNETIHTLITRRSVRKYKKAQISDEDLYLILQARHLCSQRSWPAALYHRRHPGYGYPGPPERSQRQNHGHDE